MHQIQPTPQILAAVKQGDIEVLVRDDGKQFLAERNMYRTDGQDSPFVACLLGSTDEDGELVTITVTPLNAEMVAEKINNLGLVEGDKVAIGSYDATYQGIEGVTAVFLIDDGDPIHPTLSTASISIVASTHL